MDDSENRRRAPRLLTGGIVDARCVDPLLPLLSLRDLSLGGFAIETDAEVAPGLEKAFEFHTLAGLKTIARAVSVHCHRSDTSARSFISGWRFLDMSETPETVQSLVDVLLSEFPSPEGA